MNSRMKNAHRQVIFFSAMLLCDIVLGSRLAAQGPVRSDAKTMTLGIVSEINQKEIERHFLPFVRYVAGKLSSSSKIEGMTVVAPSQSQLAGLLTERKADFYMESPHPTFMINSVYGAGKLLLRRWKGGVGDYHAVIFSSTNSETKRLEDLKGKIIAFEDPESTSGYFLPKLFLTKQGFKLSPKARIEATVEGSETGYIFAQSPEKIVDLVLSRKVAAGAFSSDDYAALDAGKKSAIAILGETASLPRHLVSTRRDLAADRTRGLEKILLAMHQNPEGLSILQKTDGTTKFDALPGGELAVSQRLLDIYYTPQKK